MNPRPLMSDEKLETANGMKNRRNVCQRSTGLVAGPLTLSSRAVPTTALMPSELSQIADDGSK